MEHVSYGHEIIISMFLVLSISHVVLDLIPLLYRRLCHAYFNAPIDTSTRLFLIIAASFIL